MTTEIIDITTIDSGVQLLIETTNAIYDIEMLDGSAGRVLLMGGYKISSPTEAVLSGSSWQNRKYEYEIRKGMTIDFFYGEKRLTTAKVVNVVVFEKDEKWYYDMEWNK